MTPPRDRPVPPARVPTTRIGRLANLALAAGELALGGLAEGLRRAVGSQSEPGSRLLTADNARRLAARLARMRGAAMKLGQMLSLQGPDLLPAPFTQALAILRAQAAPMLPAQLRRTLGREYGKGWEARFTQFDFTPIAAASIGQVHRARTTDGRSLALKIQYPGVAQSIKSDVDNLDALVHLLELLPRDLDSAAIKAEVARALTLEADYLAEAASLEHYATLVADEPLLRLPRVHRDLTTRRILAMDLMTGVPLDALAAAETPQRTRDEIGTVLERLLFRELFEFRTMQSDPNLANYLWQPDSGRIVLLDFGSTLRFDAAFARRYARITQATIAGDRDAVTREAVTIGYLAATDPQPAIDATIEIVMQVCEPLRHRGRYDFAGSDLLPRVRRLAFEWGVRQRLLRPPPPATVFLHRKLVGMFLVLARLRARVDARSLVLPALAAALRERP